MIFNSAQLCRDNGWRPGTRLVGDEGYGPTVIEITAVGERSILARQISLNGEPPSWPHENKWTLAHREWEEVRMKDTPLREDTHIDGIRVTYRVADDLRINVEIRGNLWVAGSDRKHFLADLESLLKSYQI